MLLTKEIEQLVESLGEMAITSPIGEAESLLRLADYLRRIVERVLAEGG